MIIQGDCLEVMGRMEDKSVDMVLTDLPYGTTHNSWDEIIPLNKLWDQYKRIAKDNAAFVFTSSQPFTSLLGSSNIEWLKYEYIWVKDNATGYLTAHKIPMKIHESILVFYKKFPTYNPQGLVPFNKVVRRGGHGSNYGNSAGLENMQAFTNYPRSILCFSYDKNKVHPTQKPVALFEYLIKTYTNEGDIVLDNCLGSGTTAVACKNLNRICIGIEKEEKYIELAKKRVGEE